MTVAKLRQRVQPLRQSRKRGNRLVGLRPFGGQIGSALGVPDGEVGHLLFGPCLGGGEPVSLDAKLGLKPLDVGLGDCRLDPDRALALLAGIGLEADGAERQGGGDRVEGGGRDVDADRAERWRR